jgi:hypothetical protein
VNRHARRADLASFKHDVAHAGLVTYLIGCDDRSIEREPLLARAARWWRSSIKQRRPFCPACKASFAEGAQVGAFLFSTSPAAPTAASVTAFCQRCWNSLPDDEIERVAMKVLRKVLGPGERFAP